MSAPAHRDPPESGRRGPRSLVRRLLRRGPSAEERLSALIEEHRRELDVGRSRFEESIEDLERRERRLSDARASVERLLRLGSKDLDAREDDIASLVSELTAREDRVRDDEASLARRRAEAGAVELERLLLEQRGETLRRRELGLGERERVLEERERGADTRHLAGTSPEVGPALAFVPGPGYRLVELDGTPIGADGTLVVAGEEYAVARVGPSPLPADTRRCAYLVRGPRLSAPGGSS